MLISNGISPEDSVSHGIIVIQSIVIQWKTGSFTECTRNLCQAKLPLLSWNAHSHTFFV